MPVVTKINGEEKTFDTQAAADEALANADNIVAARLWGQAAEGGAKYKSAAFGLAILRYAVDNEVKGQKLKAKELTAGNIANIVDSITDDVLNEVVTSAKLLVASLRQLKGNHQAPMKGGKLPRDVAASACVVVRPESGAAQKDAAKANILSVL